jgi:hypothetical protein
MIKKSLESTPSITKETPRPRVGAILKIAPTLEKHRYHYFIDYQ